MLRRSEEIASSLFPDNSRRNRGSNIRLWAKYYLGHSKLPALNKGMYPRLNPLLQDEDLKSEAIQALRGMDDKTSYPFKFQKWVNFSILRLITAKQGWSAEWSTKTTISMKTDRKWMRGLGFQRFEKKGDLF